MTKQVTPSGSSATMLAVRFSSLIEKKTRFSEPGEEWNCRRCLSPLEGFFAEEVALVEVPDELLLLRAVILLRDLDLERGAGSETCARGHPNFISTITATSTNRN